jgi:hypothetical protein
MVCTPKYISALISNVGKSLIIPLQVFTEEKIFRKQTEKKKAVYVWYISYNSDGFRDNWTLLTCHLSQTWKIRFQLKKQKFLAKIPNTLWYLWYKIDLYTSNNMRHVYMQGRTGINSNHRALNG